MWIDGIHLKVRLEQEKPCLLVMPGVRSDGRKELVALADGYRESTESWADLLRDCYRRGMTAPVLVGDGALGFWKAVREVFPATKEQRCWFHKQGNVPAALPKSAHASALAAIKDIYNAEDIDHAQVAIKAFEVDHGAKYPKAVAKIVDDADVLLECTHRCPGHVAQACYGCGCVGTGVATGAASDIKSLVIDTTPPMT
jgi:putative transposase